MPVTSIFQGALSVLETAGADAKAAKAREAAGHWRDGTLTLTGTAPEPPDTPSRPQAPELLPPRNMPRRRLGSEKGRATLLHAIAHIEINAIDLAFDMICRFGPAIPDDLKKAFLDDWISVGDDEARHFAMLQKRLKDYGSFYGALPAHAGLWDAALATGDDVLARLAIAPLVLEARGLDVTPGMIEALTRAGDQASADLLGIIYEEEINHVAIGARWLRQLCSRAGLDPEERFRHYVKTRFSGALKEPFNHPARKMAGLEQSFYVNLAG